MAKLPPLTNNAFEVRKNILPITDLNMQGPGYGRYLDIPEDFFPALALMFGQGDDHPRTAQFTNQGRLKVDTGSSGAAAAAATSAPFITGNGRYTVPTGPGTYTSQINTLLHRYLHMWTVSVYWGANPEASISPLTISMVFNNGVSGTDLCSIYPAFNGTTGVTTELRDTVVYNPHLAWDFSPQIAQGATQFGITVAEYNVFMYLNIMYYWSD